MKHTLVGNCLTFTFLFAACAATAVEPRVQITLETSPKEVRAGEPFELIWRVSTDDEQILQVFAGRGDAIGPERSWTHDGGGDFLARVSQVEPTSGRKEYELWTKIKQGDASRFVGESFMVQIAEQDGDQDLADFLAWLESSGYSEEIIRIYAHDGANPLVRKEWDRYFEKRGEPTAFRELKTMPLVFVDVVATEADANNELMEGQMDKLEDYMERIFGKDFDIQYHQERIAYETEFGEPALQTNSEGDEWFKFDSGQQLKYARRIAERITDERDLPSNAVLLRWAAQTWQNQGESLKIQDFTGSGPANSGASFSGYGLGLYAHEWGHGLGIGHMFVNGPGSFRSRIWGLECIMNHSYVGYANMDVGRLLSPLLRYALEPKDGYEDQASFAAEYDQAMAGTEMLESRLQETRDTSTVVSTMSWTTPWRRHNEDSIICEGLKNRAYEVKGLQLHAGIQPGTYTLRVGMRRNGITPQELILQEGGKRIASAPFDAMVKVSEQTSHTITIENYLSLDIGRSRRGSSNLFGITELLHGRSLIVPDSR